MKIIYLLKYSSAILIMSFFISCNPTVNKYYKNFDLPYMNESELLLYSGNYNAFMTKNKSFLKIAKEKNYTGGQALYYINMARLKFSQGNFKEALTILNKADQLLKHSSNKLHKAILYNQYAILCNNLNLKGAALAYNNKALNYLKKAPHTELKNSALQFTYATKGFLSLTNDSILTSFKKARLYKKEIMLESFIADYFIRMNKTDSAKIYLDKAQRMTKQIPSVDSRLVLFYYISAKYYYQTHQYQKAEENYFKALNIARLTNQTLSGLSQFIYDDLAKYYKTTGNTAKEDLYNNLYIKESSYFENKQTEAIPWVTQKFIMDMKNEEEEAHNTHSLIFINILITISIISSYFIYKQIKKIKNKILINNESSIFVKKANDKSLDNIIMLAKKNDPKFASAFRENFPDFIQKLQNLYPDLENSELTFCAMLKLNFSSKEIANYTSVLHSSVQQRKRRLRRRLNISGNVDLYTFFNNL